MVYPFHLNGHMLYECWFVASSLSSDELRFFLLYEVTEKKSFLLSNDKNRILKKSKILIGCHVINRWTVEAVGS